MGFARFIQQVLIREERGNRRRMCIVRMKSKTKRSGTVVPDIFIDSYMDRLDGSAIRVYLYLLRHYMGGNPDRRDPEDVSLSSLAAHFDGAESDLRDTLLRLADFGLLEVAFSRNRVTRIDLVDLFELENGGDEDESDNSYAAAPVSAGSSGEPKASRQTAANAATAKPSARPAAASVDADGEQPDYRTAEKAFRIDEGDVDARFNADPEYQGLADVLQQILKVDFTVSYYRLMLFAYAELHFSRDLIYYLFEYCAEIGKTDYRYITRVAIGWAEHGISTVEEAQLHVVAYDEIARVVREQFPSNRAFGKVQIEFLNRWGREWHLSAELVEEACRRTQLNTNSSDFRYADSILSRWHEAGITTIEQVKAEDARHAEKSAAARTRAKNAESRNNRFNDHSQREYSQGEMSSLELAMRNRH